MAEFDKKDLGFDGVFDPLKKGAKETIPVLEALDASFQELAKSALKVKETLADIDSKKIESINKALADSNKTKEQSVKVNKLLIDAKIKEEKLTQAQIKTEKDRIKQEKEKQKEQKKTIKLTDEEIKQKIKLQKESAQRKKDLTAELILENKSINTKRELTDQLKALRIEGENLDLGSDALKANIAEIDRLTDLLAENSDQLTKNRINVGNYKSAVVGLTDSFEDQKKKLKILEDTYKDAVSQGKKNTKEFKELTSELKDQRKAVDNVADSMDDLKDASKDAAKGFDAIGTSLKALGIGAILAIFAKLADLFGSSRTASLEAEQQIAVFTETIKTFFASMVNAWEGFKIIFASVSESFQTFFISFEKGFLNIQILFAELNKKASILPSTIREISEEIRVLETELAGLNKEQEDLGKSSNTVASGYKAITDAFDDQVDTTVKAIDLQQKYLKLQLDTEISIERQTRALAGLQERRQILQDISDDDTLGFETRALAVEKARIAAIEFEKQEARLALTREKLTIQAIKNELFRSKTLSEAALDQIKTGEQLNALLQDRNIALKVSSENEAAFTEAFVERVEKRVEAESFERDQQEKFRKTERDSFEQVLDIIEEFAEARFAINEAITNDDSKSQEERNDALKKNEKIKRDLLQQSVELILDQGKKSIDLRKDLSDAEKEEAKNKLDLIPINEILLSQNALEIQQLIRKADLGETEEKRLKDTLKIQKELTEALKEQQKVQDEADRTNTELENDIAAQEVALKDTTNEKLEELDEERLEQEKQNLRDRIEILTDGSNERLELEKELNDLLLEEQRDRLDKEKDAEESAAKNRAKTTKLILDAASKGFENRLKNQLTEIDSQLNGVQSRADELRAAAAAGNKNSQDSLAELQKQEADLQVERKKRIKEEQNAQKVLTYFKIVASKAEQGDSNPAASALKEMLLSEVIVKGIESFFVGTERTDNITNGSDSNGGRLATIHNDERIMTGSDNNELKKVFGYDISNEALKNMAIDHKNGLVDSISIAPVPIGVSNRGVELGIEDMKRTLEKALKELPRNMPVQTLDYDKIGRIIMDKIKYDNKIQERYHRNKNS